MNSFTTCLAVSLLAITSVRAGEPTPVFEPAPAKSDWSFRVAPYAWVPAIEGTISAGPLSAPVDISLSDTLDKLDMAFMGVVEIGYKRWTLGTDLVYGNFSKDLPGRGPFGSFRYQYSQWLISPTVAYRAIQTDTYHMDLFVGARVTSLDATLTGRFVGGGQIEGGADKAWVDPIVGIRGQADLGDSFFLRYNGDIGGFGVSSELVWSAFLGVGYHFNKSASVAIGYRGLGFDYSSGATAFDLVSHGPLIGFEFRF